MSDGPAFELTAFFDWLTARLCSDSDIGPRAWIDGTVPQATPLPFVVFSLASSPDGVYSGGFVGHTRPLMIVKAVGAPDDLAALVTLAAAINRLCSSVGQITLETLAIRGSNREAPIYHSDTREVGGTTVQTLNIGGRYRFMVQNYPE